MTSVPPQREPFVRPDARGADVAAAVRAAAAGHTAAAGHAAVAAGHATASSAWATGDAGAVPARRGEVASWGRRVGANLVDWLVTLSPALVVGPFAYLTAERGTDLFGEPSIMTTPSGDWAVLGGLVVALGLWIWNRWVRQGRTGRSVGKRLLGTRLVEARTGDVVGAGRAAGRELAHVLDWPGSIGYLWAIWDPRGQTFADKVAGTVVVRDR